MFIIGSFNSKGILTNYCSENDRRLRIFTGTLDEIIEDLDTLKEEGPEWADFEIVKLQRFGK